MFEGEMVGQIVECSYGHVHFRITNFVDSKEHASGVRAIETFLSHKEWDLGCRRGSVKRFGTLPSTWIMDAGCFVSERGEVADFHEGKSRA